MRKARGQPAGELEVYVPKAYGNRDDPEPVTVWIRTPTERVRRELTSFGRDIVVTGDPNGDPDKLQMTVSAVDDLEKQHEAITRCVDHVDNYVDPKGDPIATGADYATSAEPLFFHEVATKILKSLTPDEESMGKSDAPPASCSQGTKPSNGGAANAESSDSTKTETVTETKPDSRTSSQEATS